MNGGAVISRYGSASFAKSSLLSCLQVSVIQYLLVHAYKAGKLNDIKSFFADCGDSLMRGPDAEQWSAWFALPYISSPSSHPTFQVLLPVSFQGFCYIALGSPENLPYVCTGCKFYMTEE